MLALLGALILSACSASPEKTAQPRELAAARQTVQKAAALPDPVGFRRDLGLARAVLVISPNAGGVALARTPGSNTLSAPAFYTVTQVNAATGSGGTGFSRAPQRQELLAAFMTEDSMEWLKNPALPGKGGLRMEAAAASPEQRAQADVLVLDLKAPGARSVNLETALISIDAQANRAFFGKPITPLEIFSLRPPHGSEASQLQHALAALAQERKP
jgi:lipid-binding SYLF domain-containing protein